MKKINNPRGLSALFKTFVFAGITMVTLASCTHDRAVTLSEIQTDAEVPEETSTPEAPTPDAADVTSIYVYVCGKVRNPGVYELKPGSRVSDALDAAGGFTEEADPGRINLARIVTDGEMIYFPAFDEEIPEQASDNPGLININTAPASELTSVPGIGEAKAAAIVKYREQNGPFKSPADIKNVPGIGDALFSGIEELICAD